MENSNISGQNYINIFKENKIPVFLAAAAVVSFIIGIYALAKNNSDEVVFENQATGSANMKYFIDVEGAVINKGVYEFVSGERVVDAINKAGGFSADADKEWVVKNLNQAALLVDGGKLYIPSVKEAKLTTVNDSSKTENALGIETGKTNLNTAAGKELEALPGVGPVTAEKIIQGRPYQKIEELISKKIIGNSLFDKIKSYLAI